MADQKISELTALTGANVADDDAIAIVDTSATETKKIVFSELKNALDTATGFVRITGDTMTGNLNMGDTVKATFGAGSDLEIFHWSNNASYIQEKNPTGSLFIEGADIYLRSYSEGDNMIVAQRDGAVTLYYDNGAKIATTSTGIDVTGTVTADGLTVDGNARIEEIGAIAKLTLERGGTANSADSAAVDMLETNSGSEGANFGDLGTNGFRLKLDGSANDFLIQSGAANVVKTRFGIDRDTGDISFYEDTGTTAKFFWDASAETLDIGSYVGSSVNAPLNLKSDSNHHGLSIEENSGTETWQLGVDVDGDLNFHNSGNATPSVTFSDSGNVGIGTNSPQKTLDVRGELAISNSTTSYWNINRDDSDGSLTFTDTNVNERMRIGSSGDLTVKGGRIFINESDNGNTAIGLTRDADEGYVQVYSAGAITTSIRGNGDSYFNGGNVGIGTDSPDTLLHLSGADTAVIRLENSDSSLGTDQIIGGLEFEKTDGSGAGAGVVGGVRMYSEASLGQSAYLAFSTGSSSQNNVERMRISSTGLVGIGSTDPVTLGGGAKLTVNQAADGNIVFARGGSTRQIQLGTTATTAYINEDNASGGLAFHINGTERLRIDNDGNILQEGGSPEYHFGTTSASHYNWRIAAQEAVSDGFEIASGTQSAGSGALSDTYTTRFVIKGDTGNVGIGINAPTNKLHIKDSSSAFAFLDSSGDAMFAIDGSNGDFAGGDYFTIQADSSPNLKITQAGTERMCINSNGHLLVGTTDAGIYDDATDEAGHNLLVNGQYYNSTVSEINMILNRQNGDGDILQFRRDGTTTIGSIGSNTTSGQSLLDLTATQNFRLLTNGSERMRINSVGNVGLFGDGGVQTIDHYSNYTTLTLSNSTGGIIQFEDDGALIGEIFNGTNHLTIGSTVSGASLRFRSDASSEAMCISSAGNVGIGTLDPHDAGANFNMLTLNGAKGGGIVFSDDDVNQHQIYTTDDASLRFARGSGLSDESMRIDSSGNLLVGTTSTSYGSKLTVLKNGGSSNAMLGCANTATSGTRRQIDFFDGSSTTRKGSIETDGSNTSFNTSSDYRLKENVTYTWDATTRLKQLKPARFDWIGNSEAGTQDGFLAHEVSSVVPFAVSGEKDAVDENGNINPQSIDHSKLVSLLVKTIQELEARITALENA